jgi:hypothetical protein
MKTLAGLGAVMGIGRLIILELSSNPRRRPKHAPMEDKGDWWLHMPVIGAIALRLQA